MQQIIFEISASIVYTPQVSSQQTANSIITFYEYEYECEYYSS